MYPTASAPQYAFGPALAPVPMPGMASGGLAALPVKRFQRGGLSDTPVGGLFSPIAEVGPLSVTPANVIGMVAPPVVSVPLGLLGAYNSFMAKQDPAPIMEAKTAAEVEAQQAQMQADIAAAQDAEDAAQGLAMMNQTQAQPAQEVSPVDVAMDVAEAVGVDSIDAAEGATAAANAAAANAAANSGSAMGDSGAGIGDVGGGSNTSVGDAPSIGGSMDAGGSNNSGTDAGSDGASPSYQYGGRVMRYEQGGLAAAQQAQSKGRGQDTMLVHMTPGEVKGLQALAMSQGGSLTINPQTGLPEAGFLSSILPMIAGFALGPAGFGLMSSLGAGATVGALTGIATGSLKKGLMAGLGAYGGAGLGEGLVSAATPVEAAQTGIVADPSLINTSATQFPTKDITFGQTPDFGVSQTALPDFPVKNTTYGQTFGTPESGLNFSSSKNQFFDQLPPPPQVQPTGLQGAGSGIQNMLQTGPEGTAARSAFMKATPTGSLTAAGTTVASALTPEPEPLKTSKSFIRPFNLDIANPSGTPQYTPQDTREREQVRYTYSPREIYEAAEGGQIDSDYNMAVGQNGAFSDAYKEGGLSALAKRRKALAGDKYYKFADSRKDSSMEAAVEQNFAKGGLGSALPPRFLSGGGDGMSDSIKANIDGKQEARLADGEFVVPADVVSHLGNGSSKAGAKKLYSMMDKIRKARTGRTRQAPEVNPNKYMPA